MNAIELVLAFGRAWERCDIEGILAMLAPDAAYQNVPLPVLHGRDAIRSFITLNLDAAERMEWEFLAVAVDSHGRVLTERVDRFVFKEGVVAVGVMGIFEVEGGLIRRWRDYADLGSFARAMAAIGRTTAVAAGAAPGVAP